MNFRLFTFQPAPDSSSGSFLVRWLNKQFSNLVVVLAQFVLWITNTEFCNILDYGAVSDSSFGFDSSAAVQAAVTGSSTTGYRLVYVPAGDYVVNGLVVPAGVTIWWASAGARFIHKPTADGQICIQVTAGAAIAYYNKLINPTIYSPDTTFEKIGIDLVDGSNNVVQGCNISGAGTGLANFYSGGANGSIGLRIRGREQGSVSGHKIAADRPIYVAPNPNTARIDNEDLDHWNFHNGYTIARGYCHFEIESGCGCSHLSFSGFQAWVGGVGGIKIRDTRLGGGTIATRNINIQNYRFEQATTAGFAIDISATGEKAQQISIENGLSDANAQGINLFGFVNASVRNTTSARNAGACLTAASFTGALSLDGFYAQLGSVFTTTGGGRTLLGAWDTTLFAAPTHGTFVTNRAGSGADVDGVFAGSSLCPPDATPAVPVRQNANSVFFSYGVPNNAAGTDGSFCINANSVGAALTTLYQKRAGVWIGIV